MQAIMVLIQNTRHGIKPFAWIPQQVKHRFVCEREGTGTRSRYAAVNSYAYEPAAEFLFQTLVSEIFFCSLNFRALPSKNATFRIGTHQKARFEVITQVVSSYVSLEHEK